MPGLRRAIFALGRPLGNARLEEAVRYKAPYLFAIVYVYFYVARPGLGAALLTEACALSTIIGVAGIGYLSNDVADRVQDAAMGKPNDANRLTRARIVAAFVTFGACAITPWIVYFPADRTTAALLALELMLFVAYGVKPLRLKERGLAGVLTDAAYAHALPAAIAAHTLFLLTRYDDAWRFATWLLVWQLPLGARNITYHQMADYDHDRATGVRTYVGDVGGEHAIRVVERRLIPVELAGFCGWFLILPTIVPAVAFASHAALVEVVVRPVPPRTRWRIMAEHCDAFCQVWLPLSILAPLCASDPRMYVVAGIHAVVFRRPLHEAILKLVAPRPTGAARTT